MEIEDINQKARRPDGTGADSSLPALSSYEETRAGCKESDWSRQGRPRSGLRNGEPAQSAYAERLCCSSPAILRTGLRADREGMGGKNSGR